jgi:hypothetical protein
MTQKTNIKIEMPAELFFQVWNSKKSKQTTVDERVKELIIKGLKVENLR